MTMTSIVVLIFVVGFAADVTVAMRQPWWRSRWSLCYASFFILLSAGYGVLCLFWQWWALSALYLAYSVLMIGTLIRLLKRNRARMEPRYLYAVRPSRDGEEREDA